MTTAERAGPSFELPLSQKRNRNRVPVRTGTAFRCVPAPLELGVWHTVQVLGLHQKRRATSCHLMHVHLCIYLGESCYINLATGNSSYTSIADAGAGCHGNVVSSITLRNPGGCCIPQLRDTEPVTSRDNDDDDEGTERRDLYVTALCGLCPSSRPTPTGNNICLMTPVVVCAQCT